MTEVQTRQESWWSSSSWFAGGGGLQEAAAAGATQPAWRVRDGQPCGPAGVPSDKHQLAARRWGDSRDSLGAAVLGGQQAAQQGPSSLDSKAAAAHSRPAAGPAKRQRLHVGAMTGDTSDAGWAAVGGLQKQKDALMEAVAWPLAHPRLFARLGAGGARGVLLHGPPGSGKTHLVRALAAEARLGIVVLNGGECVGEEAEKRMRAAFNQAKSQAPCILLLDELDAVAPSRSAATSEHERQSTARLLAAIDELRASRARVALVGATNRREAVEPALRRAGRLDCEVALGALRAEERAEVLRCCAARMPLAPGVQLDEVAARLRGYVAADVAAVASEAALLCAVEAVRAAEAGGRHVPSAIEDPGFLESLCVTAAHFEAAVERLGPSVLRGLAPEVPAVRWDDIGGLQEAKAALRELVELPLSHGRLLEAYGLPPPRGALLYGPPGCGKTLLAKAAANECSANFLSIRGPELLSKWLGESEAAVRRVFDAARQAAPCLLFFDEFDSVGGRRSAGGSAGGDAAAARVLNQLLVEMDGLTDRGGVFVLAATNRPEALDPALTRPGRLDHLLRVPLPDAPARSAILAASLARCPLAADVDLAALAGETTEGLSGADMAEVCRRAGMAAIRELVAAEEAAAAQTQRQAGAAAEVRQTAGDAPPLQQRHLLEALSGMRPSVSAAESQRHATIERCLQEGSLEAPAATADRQLAALVRQAAAGSLQRLQERVAQLEAALRGAGLEVPLPPGA
ncbi:cell division cycle 48-like protein [Chlorella sorokiniana]|uniref:Cell division cycle 48-like protein n=1 Tax=Chlorella sorokiniana TaxID=3076 RepID=A0A2P6TBY0_CHLSO|nr:cell division cycle 48-like protein [Chlorella sorokiniana]|eukprot:PRW18391.1 cell division cycle 48-like protein [Chlorella sorokiniana]